MNAKGVWLALVVLITAAVGSAMAQMSLSDMVSEGGYDWLIGKWTATTDNGDNIYMEQKWGLDKNAVLVDFRAPGFKYRGITGYIPSREEIVAYSVDNQGGTYKGLWRQEYDAAVLTLDQTKADGTVQKIEIVYRRGSGKAIKMAIYYLESGGYRPSTPWLELSFKPCTSQAPTDDSYGSYSYYQNLGDLTSQLGYQWIAGKWMAQRSDGPAIEVTYKWVLDKYAVAVDARVGDFKYQGLIAFVPFKEEVIQVGADNMGGIWSGTWSESYEGISHRTECVRPDGTKLRVEHVYVPSDKDSFILKEYRVDADGYRAGSPSSTQTFKRVKTTKTIN